MRIIIGSDHFGYPLKEDLKQYLIELGHEPVDVGCQDPTVAVDYPDVAASVAQTVTRSEADAGIVIDATGIGSAIAANTSRLAIAGW